MAFQLQCLLVSIHARLATGDGLLPALWIGTGTFQFTPVLRRATKQGCFFVLPRVFQFTPVLRRATIIRYRIDDLDVSIHARLATGDDGLIKGGEIVVFQFTPVLRRATCFVILRIVLILVSIHARLATGDSKHCS